MGSVVDRGHAPFVVAFAGGIANLAIIPTTRPMCVTVNANTDVIIDLQTTVI